MSAVAKRYITPREYLEIERAAEFKSEYINGEMWPLGEPSAMAGTTENHNLIAGNLFHGIKGIFKGRPCRAYFADVRLKIESADIYTYPDLMALCGPAMFDDGRRDTLLNPQLIIEVLSPSTEIYDRVKKFDYYRSIPSLAEYVLVARDEPRIEVFRRQGQGGDWLFHAVSDPVGRVRLASIDCDLAMADIYDQVVFGEEPVAADPALNPPPVE